MESEVLRWSWRCSSGVGILGGVQVESLSQSRKLSLEMDSESKVKW